MKRYITEAALEAVVLAYRNARNQKNIAETFALSEYYTGKMVGLVEAFSFLTGQPWVDADVMLCKRANAMDQVK